MKRLVLISSLMLAVSCGGGNGGGTDGPPGGGDGGGGDDGGGGGDGSNHPDGVVPPGCVAGPTQCSDCVDNDGDGRIDGYDPECTGNIDNDESSFATGIPGDNIDAWKQDCFFDGNSGGGNDCDWHTCCMLVPPPWTDPCPLQPDHNWDPATCAADQTNQCIQDCLPITPPGCDCFGCCTVCDDAGCVDIVMNAGIDPDCDYASIHDPTKCFVCTQNSMCANPCDPDNCILCPGQDPSDLPPSCNGMNECPGGGATCTDTACPDGQYCANGCCITVID